MVTSFYIDDNNENKWSMFTNNDAWSDFFLAHNVSVVLRHTKNIFDEAFGKARTNACRVSVLYTDNTPISFKDYSLIFLSATKGYYHKYIYQFAHEICHVMIPRHTPAKHMWFEETLCEVASQYSLFKTLNCQNVCAQLLVIHDSLPKYIHDTQSEVIPTHLHPRDFIRLNLSEFEKDSINRKANNVVANAMVPLFLEEPRLWLAVPYICDIPESMDFYSGLIYWQQHCDQDLRSFIGKVVDLLV